MGRLHGPGKGKSRSSRPYVKSQAWVKTPAKDIVTEIVKLAKRGRTPSQIGVVLRDTMGVPDVAAITGSKILRILKQQGLAPQLPEDLYHLIKKAVNIRNHLSKNRGDKDAKFRLILVEARLQRLIRYYRSSKQLSPSFKYESSTAGQLVS
ncbi:MAG: 40S ribosomal protein S13-2 [Cercozoa sp. M6MM]